MADVLIAVVQFNVIGTTVGALQDITAPDVFGGKTPKAAMFISTRSYDNSQPTLFYSVGFATPTAQHAYGLRCGDGGTAAAVVKGSYNSRVMVHPLSSGGIYSSASLGGFIADGIRIRIQESYANNGTGAICILFGGDDLRAHLVDVNVPAGTNTVISPGFKPKIVFGATTTLSSINITIPQFAQGFGVATDTGQKANLAVQISNSSTNGLSYVGRQELLVGRSGSSAALASSINITNFTESSYTLRETIGASFVMSSLCIGFPDDVPYTISNNPIPTSGSYSVDVGFPPQFVMMGDIYSQTRDFIPAVADVWVQTLGFVGKGVVSTQGMSFSKLANPIVARSIGVKDKHRVYGRDGATIVYESIPALTSTGIDFPITTYPPVPLTGWLIAIGGAVATDPTIDFTGPDVETIENDIDSLLPDPTPDPSMDSRFTVTGGTATYALQAGTLPAGVTIDPTTGNLVGTPTEAGTFSGIVVRGTVTGEEDGNG